MRDQWWNKEVVSNWPVHFIHIYLLIDRTIHEECSYEIGCSYLSSCPETAVPAYQLCYMLRISDQAQDLLQSGTRCS